MTFTNTAGGSLSVNNLGLYSFDPLGQDDYWLSLGASIQQMSLRNSIFKDKVKQRWGYDPVLFNTAVGGWTSGSLVANINGILNLHPRRPLRHHSHRR